MEQGPATAALGVARYLAPIQGNVGDALMGSLDAQAGEGLANFADEMAIGAVKGGYFRVAFIA